MKSVESWAVAKTLDIKAGEMVVDAMCGSASFLLEAARSWPLAQYVGVDISDEQLRRSEENTRMAGLRIDFRQGDACAHMGLPLEDASVDKLMADVPFGNQYELPEGGEGGFHASVLREFARVLKPAGRIVIVVDEPHLQDVIKGVHDLDSCLRVTSVRHVKMTLRTRVCFVTIEGRGDEGILHGSVEASLWWEKGRELGRMDWAKQRMQQLPTLTPFREAVAQAGISVA